MSANEKEGLKGELEKTEGREPALNKDSTGGRTGVGAWSFLVKETSPLKLGEDM